MKKITFLLFFAATTLFAQTIPLPEHPRPDMERAVWLNLNGAWSFEFDKANTGKSEQWFNPSKTFSKQIVVPFPWGARLSGVEDQADVAWYKKTFKLSQSWKGKRVFLTIGASDWETEVWLDGHYLGIHHGGYTPFSFELTPLITLDKEHILVVRADDARRDFTLYGKQGYGNARGIWQTVYLEGHGNNSFEYIHFFPDIDNSTVKVEAKFREVATNDVTVEFDLPEAALKKTLILKKGKYKAEATIEIPNAKRWSLTDPFLYRVVARAGDEEVKTYFGMRKISVMNLPGTNIPFIALNNEPVYVQLTLDQSYHPEGYYTFPSDEFMKNEIQLCKNIGLNGIRVHIKSEIPRKLYWADKLGLLVMADLPNSWGQPDELMQHEAEYTLREMIKRDFNHPAIFSWIIFNETWGLRSEVVTADGKEEWKYLPKTQKWVESMYHLCKSLDPTRLAEDNSICCGAGHTVTDINSWHEYLPGYKWEEHMKKIDEGTYPGTTFHFEKGYTQGNQPMINSECGNVWGYTGSTGDVDWSYDYHRMMNVFRMHPKMAGWLYTEHHDVINEWNGYWRFDRSKKYTGLPDLGMEDADLHSLIYLSTGQDITKRARENESLEWPLFLSNMTAQTEELALEAAITGYDFVGNIYQKKLPMQKVKMEAWMQKPLEPLKISAPGLRGLYHVQLVLKDIQGKILHKNFTTVSVEGNTLPQKTQIAEARPDQFTAAEWSKKKWNVFDGKKMNGAGKGYFEYRFQTIAAPKSAYLLFELGAKQLFVKDQTGTEIKDDNYMLGAKADPSQNPNSYPMTDTKRFESKITIYVNGEKAGEETLADDPADHRGILSWLNQKEDGTLNEAGSYGQLVKIPLSAKMLQSLKKEGSLVVRIETKADGGIAVYGKDFGRYPFGPTLVMTE